MSVPKQGKFSHILQLYSIIWIHLDPGMITAPDF